MNDLYPLIFSPIYKDYIWGGDRIPKLFNRTVDQAIIAESWEISDRPEGMSIVSNGDLAGKSLHELVSEYNDELLGTEVVSDVFPLLIKIIDAKQCLSVQVHPNDETAKAHGGEAKTEMWYALDSDCSANIYAGLKAGTHKDSFKKAIEDEALEDVLVSMPAIPGESIYIPGGRVHAIDAGCLLLEVQQNSNTTYRVYDWGRVGHDGQPRPLHIEQALNVINWNDESTAAVKPALIKESDSSSYWEVLKSPYFHLTRIDLNKSEEISNEGKSFHALFAVTGETKVNTSNGSLTIPMGTSCLLPASIANYELDPVTDNSSVIQISMA